MQAVRWTQANRLTHSLDEAVKGVNVGLRAACSNVIVTTKMDV